MRAAKVSGIVAIDKPEGMTSRRVVDRVQHLARPAKAGHAGTLDPLATGVLVVCVGPATRLIPFVQEQRKSYRATFVLGKRSDTDDVTGTVTESAVSSPPDEAAIRSALPAFVGRIAQVPPKFSAVHVSGQRAYELARRGEEVELAARRVDVHRIDVVRYAWPELQLDIECGSGTYVRSIGRDLGEMLGCGAVMSALVRTAVGPFDLGSAVPFDSLDAETLARRLQPPLSAVPHLARRACSDDEVAALRQGRAVDAGSADFAESDLVACVATTGELVAIAARRADTGRLHPRVVLPASESETA